MSSQASAPRSDGPDEGSDGLSEEEARILREADSSISDQSEASSAVSISIDRTFELLKNERRRRVLRYLLENGESSTTGELAEHVAVLENEKPDRSALTSKERKAVYVGLYQCHLPKMDDYGVIRFNQARGTVELTDLAYELEEYLYQPSAERRWPLIYLSVAVISATTIGSSAILSLPSVTFISAMAFIGLVVAVAVAQLYTQRSS